MNEEMSSFSINGFKNWLWLVHKWTEHKSHSDGNIEFNVLGMAECWSDCIAAIYTIKLIYDQNCFFLF